MGNIVAAASDEVLADLQLIDPTITQVHYEYGHLNDVRERLRAKSQADPSVTRFPLVWLIEDFRIDNRTLGIFGIADVRIMILHTTKKEYTRAQRDANVIMPVLVPVYEELFYQMKISGAFMQYGPFVHTRITRPHWGEPSEWNNKGYLIDEVVDGIEIAGLALKIYLSKCVIA